MRLPRGHASRSCALAVAGVDIERHSDWEGARASSLRLRDWLLSTICDIRFARRNARKRTLRIDG